MIRLTSISTLLISTVVFLTSANASILAAQPFAGQWDISLENTNRKCRVTLRTDQNGSSNLAMPFGCKRAMPILSDTAAWAAPEEQRLVFADASGKPVLNFDWASDHRTLVSTGPDGEVYHMQAVGGSTAIMAASDTALPKSTETATKPAVLDKPSEAAIEGRYAIIRDVKKPSSCTISLDAGKPNGKGQHKASLETNCIDAGLKVFDPVGWREENGRLFLIAKRGHETSLARQADGTWAKDADVRAGKPMSLKKL